MEKDILSVLERKQGSFSKGQLRIARYIMENADKASYMTASKLGQKAGVSESTVVRFALELGYEGYPEMRKALQEVIRSRLTSVQRMEVARSVIGARDPLTAILNSDMENILLTQHRIKASLKKSVEADRIDVKTFMERLTEIMEKNYSNAEFDVNSLAESLDVSRSALCKIISAETGESTSKFMRSYRLEIAKDMLLKNDANRNVAQIAFKVGFNDPKYFTRCFTKKFGVTPSFFMK